MLPQCQPAKKLSIPVDTLHVYALSSVYGLPTMDKESGVNTPANILAQLKREMETQINAMRKPSSDGVRNQRRQLVCDMYARIEQLEATIRTNKTRSV